MIGDLRERKLTDEELKALAEEKARAERLLLNKDFVSLLQELELKVGGLNYATYETDAFTQGRVSLLNDIKLSLVAADNACDVFAKITAGFYAPIHAKKAAQLKETKK